MCALGWPCPAGDGMGWDGMAPLGHQLISCAKPGADVKVPDLLRLALGGVVEICSPEMWLLGGAAQHPSCAAAV